MDSVSEFIEKKEVINRKQIAIDFANSLNHKEIEKIILFGSVVRGEDNEESDIDILIITTDEDKIEDEVYRKVMDFLLKTMVYISAKIIPIKDYEKFKNLPFFVNVAKEGVIIG
ncbi:MAG: nucleotidyltransferase domain-containing protein [Methanobrevibacter sp.]|jgi:predicted nucleotidyltransferase|nr:nucleotidyltransferase domain-containing protein [Candidatus Methanovirga meridionalis]